MREAREKKLRRSDTSPVQQLNPEYCFRFGQREYNLSARTHIMGVLNVTPDSFSDGGKYLDPEKAVDRALQMIEEGADFIDIGGESTRPKGSAYGEGAEPVDAEEELRRVLPVIGRLAPRTDVPISVDTYKSAVARPAIDAGASVVNDISGFSFDAGMAEAVGKAGASAVLMHIRGTPMTMQTGMVYQDLFGEIKEHLSAGLRKGRDAGVRTMMIDPGIGFGKTAGQNLQLINGLARFADLGCPILIGPSRKSFIGTVLNLPVGERLEGTLAACVAAILRGAHVIRVHDVVEAKRASAVADAVKSAVV